MDQFIAAIDIIGVNPFVFVPEEILSRIFIDAGKTKGHIPIYGKINDKPYTQTLVKFSGHWRLYINTSMLKNSPKRIGELISISVAYDPVSREISTPPAFLKALENNPSAASVFEKLSPSRKKEIVRYLANLKSPESLNKNILRSIEFLNGKERFVGRDKP
ncbi:MAG: YdeI/OmpD-associated family protein [Flavobacteriales bacterium]|nr:YdeI/OmpD-associated family protein [Flavobacteriales bacterium]MCB9196354.1 YdeI/OmpD-associated family protein [Flavobacteriales bacterium]MCB9198563.1 YdeI/OmpD-associated family protein [Flavobacteriales bacterium]